MAQQWQGVRLEQIKTSEADEPESDIDIIAIHGLDTKSPDTWMWRSKDPHKPDVNWLADLHMLPSQVKGVRIFTCNWPADLFQDSESTPWTVDEFARRLLAGIQNMRLTSATDNQRKDRPILFITSCLGGIILMKALVIADNSLGNYTSLRKATRGIVFLATPFRGTAFQDIAAWAEPILKAWALLRNRSVTQLLDSVKGSTFDLEELVRTFTRLCQDKDYPCHVHTFYEKHVTILQHKFFPAYLLPLFGQAKLLVDSSSATLDIVPDPMPLDRSHVLMNKFFGPEDSDYTAVAGKIQGIVWKIREGRPLEKADAWIRKECYTADRLKIERLSGDLLSMDQCYINLAIVEQPGQDALDLEVETVGFYPEQVNAYLNMQPRGKEIQVFLEKHQLLQGLMRIPIQLDALCYTWEDFDPKAHSDTMTGIYKAIEKTLWKKDVLRLEKKHDGELVTRSQIGTESVKRLVEHETHLLEGLAFTGLHNDIINFTSEHREAVSECFEHRDILLHKTLPRLSFLRMSDTSLDRHDCNYHFLHLTFQEYFAARYFIRQWTAEKKLLVLTLHSQRGNPNPDVVEVNAKEFMRKEKYNVRYDIFWRFAAGLLHANHDKEQLYEFFQIIEDQPRDLLGPVHQRLVMYCLSEAVLSSEISEFKRLREQLKQWLLFEFALHGRSTLAAEIEFPDEIIEAVLREEPENALVLLLKDPESDAHVRSFAASALAAENALRGRSTMPEKVLGDLMALLNDPDSDIRFNAVKALGQLSAPSKTYQELVTMLREKSVTIQQAAAQALNRQSALSNEVLQALMPLLEDPDPNIRSSAAHVLGGQSAPSKRVMSEEILQDLVILLKDPNSGVRRTAVDALFWQSELSEEVLHDLMALLKDPDATVRSNTSRTLGEQSALSDEILQDLIVSLKVPHSGSRRAKVNALGWKL
ncbi:hypothetical protein G7Z17_g6223 [Cylindrodendrum hubeiense]|uniref:Protein SERAC1 n=1 Tax=Cylindrodendrum hubeiense TaxID=595255 RepID=A0A9P5HAB4_9HYPO|nr:hypothetical protein G7Z17_g6223 [Cylindrodendrum hubeiense]